jgi:hypothetical protein
MAKAPKTSKKAKSAVPVDAVQELADKAAQAASIGGTDAAAETGQVENKEGTVQVDSDYLRTTRLHLAVPCYNGMITESTFMSFIKFSNVARQLGLEWSLETTVNESLITRGRNTLVAKFLMQEDRSHLMFIDSDIGWEPWQLLVMLDRKVEVISGLYPMKTVPLRWVVNTIENAEERENGLHEVGRVGCGFLLLERGVFEKMNAHPEVLPFANDVGLDPEIDKYLRTYFNTDVRNNRYYSEDWFFCENWRQLGGKIWVDKRVMLTHRGSFAFSAASQDNLIGVLGPMYNEFLAQQAAAPQA